MEGDSWRWIAIALLIFTNGFFVAAEYALVGARASRLNALAKRGSRAAKAASSALNKLSTHIAGIQLGISMSGIGLGAIGESTIAKALEPFFERIGLHVISSLIAFLLVVFLMTVIGELIPKYLIIRDADRAALSLILPLNAVLTILKPFTWLLEKSGFLILLPFGVDMRKMSRPIVAREELAAMVREGQTAGEFEESHAKLVTKALRLSDLQADDVMIPRVDIQFIGVDASADELTKRLARLSHTRLIAVENNDLDEVVGILHLQDAFRFLAGEVTTLREALRPALFVPPNVTLERLIETMKSKGTQILIVRDEHGGTAGLLTLEDIVEEVFGELDDQVEKAQPRIETRKDGRIVMRADVRTDELADYLGLEHNPLPRETVATIILESIERTPKLGDVIETEVGQLRVDNMARLRITRVSLLQTIKD